MSERTPTRGPLEGIRVVDFGRVWAGPAASGFLRDLGAEVIKIESNERTDGLPIPSPEPYGDALTMKYWDKWPENPRGASNTISRGKLGVSLNLKDPRAVDLAKRIVAVSDIVIENYPPATMPKLGLGYDALRAVKNDIIMVSMSGHGSTGPERDYVSYGPVLEGIAGIGELLRSDDGAPQFAGGGYLDLVAGISGSLNALAAYYHRLQTGEGQHIDISQREGGISLSVEAVMDFVLNGRSGGGEGNDDGISAPHNTYRCAGEDRWIALAVSNDTEWDALVSVMGHPEWAGEDRFASQLRRYENRRELDTLIDSWTESQERYELTERLQQVGVPAYPTLSVEDLPRDPHMAARNTWVQVGREGAATPPKTVVGASARFSETPADSFGPVPYVGEHNDYVFGDLLGIPVEEMERLRTDGVLR